MRRPRIAILGGGAGSVTAAVKLSKPGWREHYESITLYQQGWRLGGKGASGRGPNLRIEEHGLHIWFGFYENAFRMVNECHQELDWLASGGAGEPKPRWPLAFHSIEKSFRRHDEVFLADYDGCSWSWWPADFFDPDTSDRPWLPNDPRPPGERPDELSVVFYAARCLELAADFAWSVAASDAELAILEPGILAAQSAFTSLEEAWKALWLVLGGNSHQALSVAAGALDTVARATLLQPLLLDGLDLVARALDKGLDFLRERYDDLIRADPGVRRAWYMVDLLLAIVRGLIEDGVIAADDFDVINDVEFRDWLMAHGAARETVECALIRTLIYDLPFAYQDGDPTQGAGEAGTALRGIMRIFFTYRGGLMWKMQAGMGDVVFAPLYELLVKRGVDVKFFHRVEAVRAKRGSVYEIELDVQADLKRDVKPRDFLMDPTAVWPADPSDLDILEGPKRPAGVYESWLLGPEAAKVETIKLRAGEPDGFDLVVFGLPISCVDGVAPDLTAQSPLWRASVDRLVTVPTQAMQLWLRKTATELGGPQDGIVSGGYVEPHDTWADMNQLVSQERVEGSRTVAYFCNVLSDSPLPKRGEAGRWLHEQDQLVRANALRFLTEDVALLWPNGVSLVTGELDWELLVAPDNLKGADRLDAQYLRANVEPSERYVLSVPSSSVYRIQPDDTGFTNLYAVGDWTACTLNVGCVEAAVMSGMLAANAIHARYGDPDDVDDIIGVDHP
jgi:uncharacterized protein with NAD-binding domain and iron-sulfur cluster